VKVIYSHCAIGKNQLSEKCLSKSVRADEIACFTRKITRAQYCMKVLSAFKQSSGGIACSETCRHLRQEKSLVPRFSGSQSVNF